MSRAGSQGVSHGVHFDKWVSKGVVHTAGLSNHESNLPKVVSKLVLGSTNIRDVFIYIDEATLQAAQAKGRAMTLAEESQNLMRGPRQYANSH